MMFLASEINTAGAGVAALLGYAVVFTGLIVLMLVVIGIGKFFVAKDKKKKEAAQVVEAPAPQPEAAPAPTAPGSAGGIKLHDIEIDGVYDMSADCPHMDRGLYAVRIGDVRLYGSRHATPDETYNIAVRNVRGGGDYAIALAGSIRNLTTENVEYFGGAQLLLDKRTQ